MKKSIYIITGILVVMSCSRMNKNLTDSNAITEGDAVRANELFPGTTLADLKKGQLIYQGNCGKCHKLHEPGSRSENAWKKIVPPMSKKAKLDESDQDFVLRYLVTKAKTEN